MYIPAFVNDVRGGGGGSLARIASMLGLCTIVCQDAAALTVAAR